MKLFLKSVPFSTTPVYHDPVGSRTHILTTMTSLKYHLSIFAAILMLLLNVALANFTIVPRPRPSLTGNPVIARSDQAHQPGTCAPSYTWSVIKPISTLGATCCPQGYVSEQTLIVGNLAGVFCCPDNGGDVPCDARSRRLPQTPVTCPSPGKMSGALCMNYYW